MSDKYPFIPEHLTKALEDVTIPLIDVMHGYLKQEMLDCADEIKLIEEGKVTRWTQDWYEGYMEALTICYVMTYNLSIDRKIIEENS
jgi:ABC-type molybdate transport system ATPase subunit